MRDKIQLTFSLLLLLLIKCELRAFNYGEHEFIGDKAMFKLYQNLLTNGSNTFLECAPFALNAEGNRIVFNSLSRFGIPIGYGTLNALSGDHSENPLFLEEQLLSQNGYLLKVIEIQNTYTSQHYSAAPDLKIAKLDPNYISLAAKSLFHFYVYGKGFDEHFDFFRAADVMKLTNPALTQEVFDRLHKTNAINVYVTLHTYAIYLAELAGINFETDKSKSKTFLYYAFLFNSFADHFLEDSFSAGHLLVKRSVAASVTNNKALHDFYSRYGTGVINGRGENWKAFGDGFLNQYHNSFAGKEDLTEIIYPILTIETERVINAVYLSINDLKQAFIKKKDNTKKTRIVDDIPGSAHQQAVFFFRSYPALQLIPLPYATKLANFLPDSLANREELSRANQKPFDRNFVRSRVSNSFLIGVTNDFALNADRVFQGFDFRFNAGMISSRYSFNSKNAKAGVVDVWHGYTASYSIGRSVEKNVASPYDRWMLKAGIRSNFDFWLTKNKYFGLFTYNEIGYERVTNAGGIVYVPQIGLQLGSLFNINYFNLPTLVRVPVQLLIPLKFKVGSILSAKHPPYFFSGVELDIVF